MFSKKKNILLPFFQDKPIIPTCCNSTSYLTNNNQCQNHDEDFSYSNFPRLEENSTIKLGKKLSNDFTFVERNTCNYKNNSYIEKFNLNSNQTIENTVFHLLNNGTISMNHSLLLKQHEYCIVNLKNVNNILPGILICPDKNIDEKKTNKIDEIIQHFDEINKKILSDSFFNKLFFTISIFLHTTGFFYFIILKPGKLLNEAIRKYNIFFCISILTWIFNFFTKSIIFQFINYTTILSCFFWINICYFEIFWTIKNYHESSVNDVTKKAYQYRLFWYKIYGFGCPLIIVTISLCIKIFFNYFDHDSTIPKYEVENCWFIGEKKNI